jgi:hypothetical protein
LRFEDEARERFAASLRGLECDERKVGVEEPAFSRGVGKFTVDVVPEVVGVVGTADLAREFEGTFALAQDGDEGFMKSSGHRGSSAAIVRGAIGASKWGWPVGGTADVRGSSRQMFWSREIGGVAISIDWGGAGLRAAELRRPRTAGRPRTNPRPQKPANAPPAADAKLL